MTQALNIMSQALILLVNETAQMRKMLSQNPMALGLVTAVQGDNFSLLHVECCIYIPDYLTQI